MARIDEEEENRRRRRIREDEQEAEELRKKEAIDLGLSSKPPPQSNVSTSKFDELIERAEITLKQLDTLYNMYFSGAEKIPPVIKRQQLDQLMVALQAINKPTLRSLFRYNSMQSRYAVHVEKWDRKLRNMEGGTHR